MWPIFATFLLVSSKKNAQSWEWIPWTTAIKMVKKFNPVLTVPRLVTENLVLFMVVSWGLSILEKPDWIFMGIFDWRISVSFFNEWVAMGEQILVIGDSEPHFGKTIVLQKSRRVSDVFVSLPSVLVTLWKGNFGKTIFGLEVRRINHTVLLSTPSNGIILGTSVFLLSRTTVLWARFKASEADALLVYTWRRPTSIWRISPYTRSLVLFMVVFEVDTGSQCEFFESWSCIVKWTSKNWII